MSEVNIRIGAYSPSRCVCGWEYGRGVGVLPGYPNRHSFNQNCSRSFQRRHPNGYDNQDCCGLRQPKDEGFEG